MDAHDDLLEADPSKREGVIVREGQVHKDFFIHSTIVQNWFHLNESLKKKQQAAATQFPKRLPQPYRPTQEEQKEIMDLDRLVRDTPEFKLIQKEARELD